MKKAIILISSLAILATSFTKKLTPAPIDDLQGTISISGSFALYPLSLKWGEEFKKLHPNIQFAISPGSAGKGISDALAGLVDLGAASRDIYPEEIKKGAFAIAITKDAVVPIVNSANPNIEEILTKGLKRDAFANIYANGAYKNWKQAGFSIPVPIRVYTRSDASGAGETWAKYFGKTQEDLDGIGVYGDPGLLEAVKKDVAGIGYNDIGYAYSSKSKKQLAGITVVPIDINGNGKIDTDEDFYGSREELIKAITAGKYPSPPTRDVYFVSKNKPRRKEVTAFLKWVLTDGQKFASETGYIRLTKEKLTDNMKILTY
jgi:phosphate transport system substrate-binding protein